jgi:cell migration-inducing and hyaluronan-binding protein
LAPPAPQPPVIVSRNGKDHRLTGANATVRAGSEMRVKTERPQVAVSLSEMDKGSWVLVELPGFTRAESGMKQDSLDALRKAGETSYYTDKKSLWVKLVAAVEPNGPLFTQASLTANR